MKHQVLRLLAIVAGLALATPAGAQCVGAFPAQTVCGNPTGAGGIPLATSAPVLGTSLTSPLINIGANDVQLSRPGAGSLLVTIQGNNQLDYNNTRSGVWNSANTIQVRTNTNTTVPPGLQIEGIQNSGNAGPGLVFNGNNWFNRGGFGNSAAQGSTEADTFWIGQVTGNQGNQWNVTLTANLELPKGRFATYNTVDNIISNYERGQLAWVNNFFDSSTTAAGSGTVRGLTFSPGGTEAMRIDTAGAVTVGGNPSLNLNNLNWSSTTTGFEVISNSASKASIGVVQYNSSATAPALVNIGRIDSNTIGGQGGTNANDRLGVVVFFGSDGTNVVDSSWVLAQADANSSPSRMPGRLSFYTGGGSSIIPVEAIRIDSGQNVNIGNQGALFNDVFGGSPRLQVTGTGTNAELNLRRYSADQFAAQLSFVKSRNGTVGTNTTASSGDTLGYITFDAFDTNPTLRESASIQAQADAAPDASSVAGRLVLGTNAAGTNGNPTERMRIDSKGHINFTTPAPTNSACTGFALGTGSSDTAGRVTFTSATSCAISFGTAFTNAPFCTISPGSAASTTQVTTSTTVLTATFGTAQTAMFYHCFGS